MSISTPPKEDTGTTPAISGRAQSVPSSPIRKLADLAISAKERGVKVYHLNIGQPDVATPPEFFQGIREFSEKVVEYGHSKGLKVLLEAWARYYAQKGLDVEPNQIQVTTGGSEAVAFSFMLTCDTGDNVVVSEPFYTNYGSIATALDIKLKPVQANPDLGYCLPAREEIENAIDDRTRALMICSPNNPTGTVLRRDEVATVVQIADERKLFVISDEVYREFCYEGDHTSIWQFAQIGDRAILLDSISKRFSACGARIGALVCRNTQVMDAALRLGQARLSTPTVEQVAAARLMDLGEDYYAQLADEYKSRRDLMFERLEQMPGVFCRKPSGAFYMMATLPVDDSDRFCRWMLTDFSHEGQTVMMAPGDGFYSTPGSGRQEARLAYVLKTDELSKAMDTLAVGLEAYPGRQDTGKP
ncbi:MAG: aminotransferase class I/II-fold pyridoxal phosphate-dependent enzyme [candidate division Zixibacteria bacterium]|nr:aminotransferase class I/II-fold pyridoxal phosphate-dependent enzyme [candidate division Zixibacteria bacterium]